MTDADRKAQENLNRSTDMAPPSRVDFEPLTVKVECREGQTHAHITTKDGKVDMFYPFDLIRKRFSRQAVSGYFRCQIKSGIGVLEIGERVDLPAEKQW